MYGNFGGDRRPQGRFVPVKVGDELEVTIEAVGHKGDGIAKKDGFVLFIPNTKEGQTVKVRVTKVFRKVGFAEVIGEGSAAPAGEQPEETEAETEGAAEEPAEESAYEDTEDFGEEEPKEESGSEEEQPEDEESAEEAEEPAAEAEEEPKEE